MSATAASQTTIDQRIDSTNIVEAVAVAERLIADCERDLNRRLSRGECNDLLMDNTTWTRSEIVAVMDSVRRVATYTIQHTSVGGTAPFWYHLECAEDLQKATIRARNYALDHGGYVCVKDESGKTVFGTDPDALNRAILNGTNRDFPSEAARRVGCCV